MGRDRPAAPRAVPVLRHPRRPRPARHPLAARPGLRRRGAQQRSTPAPTPGPASSSSRWPSTPTPPTMRCLGFCVSVEHARFMARHFTAHGIAAGRGLGRQPAGRARGGARATSPTGECESCSRSTCSTRASTSRPSTPCSCCARPRARRCSSSSSAAACARRPARRSAPSSTSSAPTARSSASTAATAPCSAARRRDVERAVQQRFPFLPAGCNMQLDQKATEIVLRSLREAIPSRWPAKVDELRSLRRDAPDLDLAGFLDESGLDLDDVYDGGKSWSDLQRGRRRAGARRPARTRRSLRRAVGRLLHIDDDERIATYRRLLASRARPSVDAAARAGAAPRSTCSSPASPTRRSPRTRTLQDAVDLLWAHPQVRAELLELLAVLDERVDHVHAPLETHPDVPLQVHARYSRIEILAAFGLGDGRQDRRLAERRLRGEGRQRRAVRLHARQEQRRLLPHHPLPRLRHQPHAHPLGEPVDHASRQPDRPPLPQPRARRPRDPAVHPPPSRRPSVLVPRPRHLPRPRRREADGHHLGARPPACRATSTPPSPPPWREGRNSLRSKSPTIRNLPVDSPRASMPTRHGAHFGLTPQRSKWCHQLHVNALEKPPVKSSSGILN